MGALEFEPAASELERGHGVDVGGLYQIALKVLEERDNALINPGEELTMQTLLAVGTSAGGRQMKAILAVNPTTGVIRSGQTDCPAGFEHWIVKFGDAKMPTSEIEMAYYMMARDAGIEMEECQLVPVEGINHFMTRRFDRKNGKKIHMQTLAAINPEASSYEDLVATAREIGCSESEIAQIYRRMVFNVLGNNTDDHNKNFSFLLEQGGRWHLSPAYDVTFIFNERASGAQVDRRSAIRGKVNDINYRDLVEFARENDIPSPIEHIEQCIRALRKFPELATVYGISAPWSQIIWATISENLARCNNESLRPLSVHVVDKAGRDISDVKITVNAQGHYVVSAKIDGRMRRRFVRPNMDLYTDLSRLDLGNLSERDVQMLVDGLFLPTD